MTAPEVLSIVMKTMVIEEEKAFEATIKKRTAEGWANPLLQAQNQWQGYDNGVVFDSFAQALEHMSDCGQVPTGCKDFDPEGEVTERDHLLSALATSGVIGTGEPLAYVGVHGYFTLIRDGATVEQIEQAVIACLPSSEE